MHSTGQLLNLALEKAQQEQWQKADIMLVSDGEFPVPSDLVRKINEAKNKRSISVHGTLIGSADHAMKKICDPLHRFSSWIDLQLKQRDYSSL